MTVEVHLFARYAPPWFIFMHGFTMSGGKKKFRQGGQLILPHRSRLKRRARPRIVRQANSRMIWIGVIFYLAALAFMAMQAYNNR